MKNINVQFLIWLFLVFAGTMPSGAQTVAPTTSQNHTVSYTFRQAFTPSQVPASVDVTQAATTVTYYDGAGRPVQSVEAGGTYGKKDLVKPVEYDVLGRADVKSHLPYPLASAGGGYQSTALAAQKSYYTSQFSASDANYAYSFTGYDDSPLQRVTTMRKPGSTYQSHPTGVAYSLNTAADNVLRIRVNTSDGFYIDGTCPASSLFKTVTTNEDGLAVHVFSDHLQRTLLERTTDGTTVMNTYYVYDGSNAGHLRWVVPPEASKSLGTSGTYGINDNLPKQFCYYYKYNGAGDVIEKREPGSDPVYMHYNTAIGHKLVAKQTGSQRTKNEWFLYEYHPTGELYRMYRYRYTAGNGTPAQIDSRIAAGTLYATTNVQEGGVVALYEFDRYASGPALTFQAVSGLTLTPDQTRVKGLKTYEKVFNTDNSTYAERRFYYDSKVRLIQVVERNHLGYTSRYSFEYDFSGNTLTSHESHQVDPSTTHTVLKRNTYDHRHRLLSSTTTLNGGTPATVGYTYDELGQLKTRKLGDASTATSRYNIQGWLTSQSSPEFSLYLSYGLTGNIDHMCAFNPGLIGQCNHIFEYDMFGRLLSGYFSTGRFGEEIAGYDLNGNIQGLRRISNGFESANWQYSYTGNRLTGLSGVPGSYTYDQSGNMLNDPRKNLVFSYNSLNLLDEVKSGSTVKAKYLFSYDGTKVRVQDSGGTNGYDYLGSLTLVKTGGTQTPETHFGDGIIRGTQVMYFERDHLGSVRSVLNSSGTVLERNDYYPFGTRHETAEYSMTANNRFKYNGKEDQTVGALGLLDYGARMYDAQIGRWLGVDPLADSYYPVSPYAYCANNPVRFIDPNGMFYDDYISSFNGKFLGSDNFPSKRIYMIDDEKFHEINKKNGITIYDKAVGWKKNGREVVIEELAIRTAAQDVGDNSMTTGLEHQIYLSFDRNSGKVSFVDGGSGVHDQVDLVYYPAPQSGVNFIDKPGGQILVGQIHGHPASPDPNKTTLKTMSTQDESTSKSVNIPIYGIDAMDRVKVGTPRAIHRVTPDGVVTTNVGTTNNFNFGYDAFSKWIRRKSK